MEDEKLWRQKYSTYQKELTVLKNPLPKVRDLINYPIVSNLPFLSTLIKSGGIDNITFLPRVSCISLKHASKFVAELDDLPFVQVQV